jgi:hypothetical protein
LKTEILKEEIIQSKDLEAVIPHGGAGFYLLGVVYEKLVIIY